MKYSYQELLEAQKIVNEMSSEIGSYYNYVNEFDNCLVIGSEYELSKETKDLLAQKLQMDNLQYEVTPDDYVDDVTYTYATNGDRIVDSTTGGKYSLGAAVKWTSKNFAGEDVTYHGWITSAHKTAIGDVFTYNGSVMGKVVRLDYAGALDSCLILRDDASTVRGSTKLHGTDLSFSKYGSPVAGKITMYGNTSGTTSGEIQSISCTRTIRGIQFTDLIQAQYTSLPGDSGAPLVQDKNKDGTLTLVGINKGHSTIDGEYCCLGINIRKICDAYGVAVASK